MPEPLARNSKSVSVTIVLIVFPLILILSMFDFSVDVPDMFKFTELKLSDSNVFCTSILPIVVVPLTVRSFSITTFSPNVIVPDPLARNSKLAFESLVLIIFPLRDTPSNILLPTPDIFVAVILSTVRVLLIVVACSEIGPDTVKLFSAIKFSLIRTIPVPLALNSKSLLESVLVTLFPANIISSNIICLFSELRVCTINLFAPRFPVEVDATVLVAGVIISPVSTTSSWNLTVPVPLALSSKSLLLVLVDIILSAIAIFSITASPDKIIFCESSSSPTTLSNPDALPILIFALGATKFTTSRSDKKLTFPVPAGSKFRSSLPVVVLILFPLNSILSNVVKLLLEIKVGVLT